MVRNNRWGNAQPVSMGMRLFLDLSVVMLFTIAAVLVTGGGATSAFLGALIGMFVAEALSRSLRERRTSSYPVASREAKSQV